MYNDRDTLMKVLDLIIELDLQEFVVILRAFCPKKIQDYSE